MLTENIENQFELEKITNKHIRSAINLTKVQKKQLLDLFSYIDKKVKRIDSKLQKSKFLLYKNAISNDYSSSKEKLIKDIIKSLEKDKQVIFLERLESTNKLLGHKDIDNNIDRLILKGNRVNR